MTDSKSLIERLEKVAGKEPKDRWNAMLSYELLENFPEILAQLKRVERLEEENKRLRHEYLPEAFQLLSDFQKLSDKLESHRTDTEEFFTKVRNSEREARRAALTNGEEQ